MGAEKDTCWDVWQKVKVINGRYKNKLILHSDSKLQRNQYFLFCPLFKKKKKMRAVIKKR